MISSFSFGKATLNDAVSIKSLLDNEDQVGSREYSSIIGCIRDFFVAKADGKIIGCIALRFIDFKRAVLESLVVEKGYRNRGIGSRFVELCLKEAKIMGAKEVVAFSSSPAFFERMGFRVVGEDAIGAVECMSGCVPMVNDLEDVE